MSRSVGVLMRKERDHGVFLTPNGSFIKGRSRVLGAELGEEVEFIPVRSHLREWARYGLVAVLMLAIMISGLSVYLTRPVIAAYVTIDINPSVEFGIDQNEIVRSVAALNPEAEALIEDLELAGKQVTEALEVLMARAAEDGYLGTESEHLVVITTTAVAGQPTYQDGLTAELESKAQAIVAGQEQTVVTSMVAAPEIREEARKQGMSVGKLMVAQKAEDAGIHLNPQELKSSNLSQSIRAAGGDPEAILKKETGRPANDNAPSKEDKDTEKAGNQTDKDKPGKGNQGNGRGNSSESQDKGNSKGNDNNGKSGQAPGQSKR